MNWTKGLLKEDNILKEANTAEVRVVGQGIDALIRVFQRMNQLGAPDTYDDQGFNKIHFGNRLTNHICTLRPGDSMSIQLAIWAVQALRVYKNRQVTDWDQIKMAVENDINVAKGLNPQAVQPQQPQQPNVKPKPEQIDMKIKYVGPGQFGKQIYEIHGMARFPAGLKELISNEMNRLFQGGDRRFAPVPGYNGGLESPIFKAITKSKSAFDQFEIHPQFASIISEVLGGKGYDTTELNKNSMPASNSGVTSPVKPQVKTVEVKALPEPFTVSVSFGYDERMVGSIKSLPFASRKWDGPTKSWHIQMKDKKGFDVVKNLFIQNGYDSTPFDAVVAAMPEESTKTQLQVMKLPQPGPFNMAIRVTMNKDINEALKQALRYTFPDYEKMRSFNKESKMWTLAGAYSQFMLLAEVLEQHDVDGNPIRNVAKQLVQSKEIKEDKVSGTLDGYLDADGKNNVKAFDARLDAKFAIPLYDKQKDGVRFMYSRNSAVMGDETGAGKTFQMIAAASMRLEQNGGQALIVTLASTQIQWIKAIKQFTKGEDEVSADPTSDAKWIVTYYHMFSNGRNVVDAEGKPILTNPEDPKSLLKKRDETTQALLKKNFQVLILDESHSVKNDSITSDNIELLSKNIPFKWGASATLIANKAIDAYRQFRILGHPLGMMSEGRFKREFAGMKPEGFNGAYIEGSRDEQIAAANDLRKWMIKTGAYIKRTKKDINPNLPNHTIDNNPIKLDERKFEKGVKDKLKNYKDDTLEISKMIAERMQAAEMKVPFTLEMAENILEQGKKVLVFTCFIEPAKQLTAGLEKIVAQYGGGKVDMVAGGMSKEKVAAAVERFKSDPNAKAMVLSIIKGGTGIDLPNVVEDVLINDFSWTPKEAEQSEGRAFRINSTSDVHTTYVVAENSSDSHMFDYVQQKKRIAKTVQDLEAKEREMIMKGLSVSDIKKQIIELSRQSAEADASVNHIK